MKKYLLPFIALLMVNTTSWGKSIELDIHNEALSFNYVNSESIFITGMGVEAGLLMRESVSPLIHAGLSVAGKNLSEVGTIDISMGGRLYNLSESGSSFTSIALGGKVRLTPMNRVGLSAHLYFAPDITTFGDSDRMSDFMLRADYQVIPQAFAYIGHRQVAIKNTAGNFNMENDWHVGIKLLF